MSDAIIIPFPKRKSVKDIIVKRSADLQHAWNKRLINPKLKGTYKDSISWLERWYLESRHLANTEQWDHPLLLTVMLDKAFNEFLRESCLADIAIMEKLAENPIYRESSVRQRKRLIIWHNKFAALYNYAGKSSSGSQ